MDCSTHEAEGQTSAERGGGGEEEEEGGCPDIDEEEAGGQIAEETKPGGDYPDKPEHISGGDPLDPGPELVSGADCPGKTKPEIVPGEDPPETELERESGEDCPGEPVSVEAPSSGVKPETEVCPECLVAKTSQRSRPKLSRMERVQSSPSLSSEEEKISRSDHRLVLLKSKKTWFL